jgi:hypothetical protein
MLQPTGGLVTPQCQMISRPNGYQTPNTGNQSVQKTPANQNVIQTPPDKKCYNCGQKGHFAIALPPVICLWGWLVPLLFNESVSIVLCVKKIFMQQSLYI